MGTFNYRVFKEDEQVEPNVNEEVYTIRLVGYNNKGEPINYTEPYWPLGTTTKELIEDIGQMMVAFSKPILTKEDFK